MICYRPFFMNSLLKILRISIVSLLTVVALLVIASSILEPRVSRIFLEKAKESINTRAEAGKINFSLLKNFPRASVELENLTIYSPNQTNDTILTAGNISLSLKIIAFIRKEYIVDRLSIEDARLLISESADGKYNLDIFKKQERKDSSMVSVELRNVRILNSRVRYVSPLRGIDTDVTINNSVNRISFGPVTDRIETNINLSFNSLTINNFTMPSMPGKIKINASLAADRGMVTLEKLSLEMDEFDFSAEGFLDRTDSNMSLKFEIAPLSSSYILSFPGIDTGAILKDYNIKGIISAAGTMAGKWDKGNKPPLNASLILEKGAFSIPGKRHVVTGIRGKGSLTFDPDNLPGTLAITLNPFSASIAGSLLKGSISLIGVKDPLVDLTLTGDLESSSIISFIDDPGVEASGMIRTNLRLWGRIPKRDKYSSVDILGLNRSLNMNLRSVDFTHKHSGLRLDNISGNIMVSDNIWFDGITFILEGSEMAMNGRLDGFDRWISKSDERLTFTAGIWSSCFDFAIIDNIRHASGSGRDKSTGEKVPLKLALNLDLNLDSLVIGNFRASMFRGEINYSNDFMNISSFSLSSLKGYIGGNVAVARLSSGRYIGKGWFDIGRIDIRETFSVFNNFRQSYITDENLRGRLSGNLSITSELDSLFIPLTGTIVATGDYTISDGELVDFEPIMALSRFVELSELRDIRFSELKNDLSIRDRTIIIPSMNIKSSAFDISLSGDHAFEGSYNYHLRLLLSDILSSKASEKNNEFDEFGVIEPDGLGRTSLYLKIEGDGDGSKVSWDMKNLKSDLRKDMQEEKGNLKSLLREEYGWYSNDTIPLKRKEETKKFRITWEETDSIRTEVPVNEEKGLPLKNIFRKKKKIGEG